MTEEAKISMKEVNIRCFVYSKHVTKNPAKTGNGKITLGLTNVHKIFHYNLTVVPMQAQSSRDQDLGRINS